MLRTLLALTAVVAIGALVAAAVAHRRLTNLKECLMADLNDVNAALDANDAAQTEALNRVAEDVAELQRRLAEIPEAADLQPVVDRLAASTARLQGVDPDPSFPAPAEPTA